MKRRLAVGLVALALILMGLYLWLRSSPESPTEPLPTEAPAPKRVGRAAPAAPAAVAGLPLDFDPDTLAAAASGDHGLALRNRVCKLCIGGVIVEEGCRFCLQVAETGRVNLDVVGTDGRPFPDHDVMVGSDCGRGASLGSGFLDLPAGPCTLTATRVEGPFDITGPPKTVQIVAGEELYLLLEIPAEAWGGVGVTLRSDDRGLVIDGLGGAGSGPPG